MKENQSFKTTSFFYISVAQTPRHLLTNGLELSLAQANLLNVFAEEFTQVVESECHECHTVNTDSPCKDWNVNAHSLGDFRTEDTAAAKFEPTELRVLDVHFD